MKTIIAVSAKPYVQKDEAKLFSYLDKNQIPQVEANEVGVVANIQEVPWDVIPIDTGSEDSIINAQVEVATEYQRCIDIHWLRVVSCFFALMLVTIIFLYTKNNSRHYEDDDEEYDDHGRI